MTEITVNIDKSEPHKVRKIPFILALIAAPLITGLPAYALLMTLIYFDLHTVLMIPLMIVSGATLVGAPTYLLFGAPAFFMALRKHGPDANTIIPAMVANLISAPVIFLGYLALEGADGGAFLSTLFMTMIGFPFAAIWGLLFSYVYQGLCRRWAA